MQAMKNKFSIITLLAIITISLTGCTKYEKDESYDTDLYGSYSKNIEAYVSENVYDIDNETKYSYYLCEKYQFNTDDTYQYTVKETIYDDTVKDNSDDGNILSIEEISDDITKITLDQEITEWSTGEKSNQIIYKYKNMLGSIVEIEVPKSKTFELYLDSGVWFDEEGQYHTCIDSDSCNCSEINPHYIRKSNIIYFQSMDDEHSNCYTIGCYILDNGLFCPSLYKE